MTEQDLELEVAEILASTKELYRSHAPDGRRTVTCLIRGKSLAFHYGLFNRSIWEPGPYDFLARDYYDCKTLEQAIRVTLTHRNLNIWMLRQF